jgi:hypothetical protein
VRLGARVDKTESARRAAGGGARARKEGEGLPKLRSHGSLSDWTRAAPAPPGADFRGDDLAIDPVSM